MYTLITVLFMICFRPGHALDKKTERGQATYTYMHKPSEVFAFPFVRGGQSAAHL